MIYAQTPPEIIQNIDLNKTGKFGACTLFCSGDLCSWVWEKTNFEKTACKVKFHIFLLETTIWHNSWLNHNQ